MIGLLVHGENHFIVDGPRPDARDAAALARHWSIIQINRRTPYALARWKIVNKAFRENLRWVVIVPAEHHMSPAVATLVNELAARGILP